MARPISKDYDERRITLKLSDYEHSRLRVTAAREGLDMQHLLARLVAQVNDRSDNRERARLEVDTPNE